jgi:hypothetical protein
MSSRTIPFWPVTLGRRAISRSSLRYGWSSASRFLTAFSGARSILRRLTSLKVLSSFLAALYPLRLASTPIFSYDGSGSNPTGNGAFNQGFTTPFTVERAVRFR